MGNLLAFGLFAQIFAPFLVTCIFTLIGFFVGRAYGRRQGYDAGWFDAMQLGHDHNEEMGGVD